MSRKILVVLVALFVFVVMLFTMGPGFAQVAGGPNAKAGGPGGPKFEGECKDGVFDPKAGGTVSPIPCETPPTK